MSDEMTAVLPAGITDDPKAEFQKLRAALAAEWAAFRTTLTPFSNWHINWDVIYKAYQFIIVNVPQFVAIVDPVTGLVNEDKLSAVMAFLGNLLDTLIRPEIPAIFLPIYVPALQWILTFIRAEVEIAVAKLHGKPPSPIPAPVPVPPVADSEANPIPHY